MKALIAVHHPSRAAKSGEPRKMDKGRDKQWALMETEINQRCHHPLMKPQELPRRLALLSQFRLVVALLLQIAAVGHNLSKVKQVGKVAFQLLTGHSAFKSRIKMGRLTTMLLEKISEPISQREADK